MDSAVIEVRIRIGPDGSPGVSPKHVVRLVRCPPWVCFYALSAKCSCGGHSRCYGAAGATASRRDGAAGATSLLAQSRAPAPGVPASRGLTINEFVLNFMVKRAAPTDVAPVPSKGAAPAAPPKAKASLPLVERPA